MDFDCQSETTDGSAPEEASSEEPSLGAIVLAAPLHSLGLIAPPEANLAFTAVRIDDLHRQFAELAKLAVENEDADELHNIAVETARRWKVDGFVMRRLLERAAGQNPALVRAVADWRDSDAEEPRRSELTLPSDEELNALLAAHAVFTNWHNAGVARELYRVQIAAKQSLFGNRLPLMVLSFERTAKGSRSSLRVVRTGLAIRYEANFHLDNIGRSRRLRAVHVIHEQIHLRQALERARPPGGYHNEQFREWSEQLGLPTNAQGAYLGVVLPSRVARLFEVLGVPDDAHSDSSFTCPKKKPRAREPELVAWYCGCTRIFAQRGIDVRGRCRNCGNDWTRSPRETVMALASQVGEDLADDTQGGAPSVAGSIEVPFSVVARSEGTEPCPSPAPVAAGETCREPASEHRRTPTFSAERGCP